MATKGSSALEKEKARRSHLTGRLRVNVRVSVGMGLALGLGFGFAVRVRVRVLGSGSCSMAMGARRVHAAAVLGVPVLVLPG